jgi:hypothetical protein
MTYEEAMRASAGRATDAIIADEVMDLQILARDWPCGYSPDCGNYRAAPDDDEWYRRFFAERGPVYAAVHDYASALNIKPLIVPTPVPFYTTSFMAAWQLLRQKQWVYSLKFTTRYFEPHGAYAHLLSLKEQTWSEATASLEECDGDLEQAQALAICRAALLMNLYLQEKRLGEL